MRIAALVKQIPVFEEMRLRDDGRLEREGLPLEMSAYCRRAVAKGVDLAAAFAGTCTVFTMGPPQADDVLREAVAFGADAGVHLCDPAFAGSDTLATARALAAALRREGPFDLILVGRNSVDADTGQVGPQIAELLDLPFATGVKHLDITNGVAVVGLEQDDLWVEATVELPAVLSVAERLIDPCKIKDPLVWASVDAARITCLGATDLRGGAFGAAGSPTRVGEVRTQPVQRAGRVLEGSVAEQVAALVAALRARGALTPRDLDASHAVSVPPTGGSGPVVAVLIEPERTQLTRELLSAAARLAASLSGSVVAFGPRLGDPRTLGTWGADEAVLVEGAPAAEDVAAALGAWITERRPWAVLAGGTAWGREVAARAAAHTGSGLTGDAISLDVERGRLVAFKPAFGGSLVAGITATSPTQMATVRAGVLRADEPRESRPARLVVIEREPRERIRILAVRRDDASDVLAEASVVVGVGMGVDPAHYVELEGLCELLGAELAATRKVTDRGWMPHARQIGITGHSVAPRLFVSVGASGKLNHSTGLRGAGTVVALNADPEAPIFGFADLGIVGDWREVIPVLTRQLAVATRRIEVA